MFLENLKNLKGNCKINRFKYLFYLFIGSFCFIGFIPFASGTFGALAGLFFFWLFLKKLPILYQIFFCLVSFFLGVFVSSKIKIFMNKSDPKEVVIDEVVGIWIALLGKNTLFEFFLAFIFFRFFDITKPFYISKFEKFPDGWGIMLDDAVSGIYTFLLLYLITLFVKM